MEDKTTWMFEAGLAISSAAERNHLFRKLLMEDPALAAAWHATANAGLHGLDQMTMVAIFLSASRMDEVASNTRRLHEFRVIDNVHINLDPKVICGPFRFTSGPVCVWRDAIHPRVQIDGKDVPGVCDFDVTVHAGTFPRYTIRVDLNADSAELAGDQVVEELSKWVEVSWVRWVNDSWVKCEANDGKT